MKVSKEQNALNRQALVNAASRLMRERGFGAAGVAEISKSAGLTHGAVYAHFPTKEALALAANRHAQTESLASLASVAKGGTNDLQSMIDYYVSTSNRDSGCPMPAYVSEVDRQPEALGREFMEGFGEMVDIVAGALPADAPKEERRRRAITLVSGMVGAVSLARAARNVDPALSKEILASARADLLRGSEADRIG